MANKILVTGAFGQIGSELVPALQKKYGVDNVVAMGHSNIPTDFKGTVEQAEITDIEALKKLVTKYRFTDVYHLVSILSARGEQDPQATWEVNMGGLKNILDLAKEFKFKIFWPSTIAAFGPNTPKDAPQDTIMQPTTMYGVTKVAGEQLANYYFHKFGVDIRSVRYPGIISWKTPPGGGTSDYAVAIFYEGLKTGKYECFVGPQTMIPMMYVDDAIRATVQIMDVAPAKIKIRTSYNLAAISFTAEELATEINKHIKVEVSYKPDYRQAIADSWPQRLLDTPAREDWGWKHEIDLPKMVEIMLAGLRNRGLGA